MVKRNYKYIMFFIMSYFLFTILLFDFGPIKYELLVPFKLHIYLFLFFISFFLGFCFFLKIKHNDEDVDFAKIHKINDTKINDMLKYGIYIYAFLMILSALNFTNQVSITNYITKVINGLLNPAVSYYAKVNNQIFLNSYLNLLLVLLSPYTITISVLGIIRFKKLRISQRVFLIMGIAFDVTRWLALGTNKGVFDIFILLIAVFLLNRFLNVNTHSKQRKSSFKQKLLIILSFILIFFTFTYFISSRMYVKNRNLKDVIDYGYQKITSYIVQGYKGLDYSLTLDWNPTYGIGNSVFLTHQIDKIFHSNISLKTYQKRAEIYGWSSTVNWHSVYSWFANDVSFVGVIPLMFIIGMFLASLLRSIDKYGDYYSAVLFYLVIMGVFYSSANNQVLSFANTCVAFYVLLLLKLIRNSKYKRIKLRDETK